MIARRPLLLAGAAGLALAALGGRAMAQNQARLRAFWWGNPDRDKRTRAALDAFAKANDIQISADAAPWGDYWTKLATQTAGGNAPDLIQMDYRYLFEYARRGSLLDLGSVMPKSLDLADFNASARDAGKVDGKLFAVTLGTNSKVAMYNRAALDRVGLKEIPFDWTWDEHRRVSIELSKLEPGKFWGSADNSRQEPGFEQWLQQRGKNLYTEEGRPGFTREDAVEWYAMWDALRKAGAIAPPEIGAASDGGAAQFEVTRNLTAIGFAHSNQLTAYQALNKNPLAITVYPQLPGGKSGHYIKPAMLMSVAARTRNADLAGRVVNFLVNEPEGVQALGIERGVPGSAKSQGLLAADLDELGKAQVNYVAAVSKIAVALPPPPPKGAGEIEKLMLRLGDAVAFGRTSVADGGAQLFSEATAVLDRA